MLPLETVDGDVQTPGASVNTTMPARVDHLAVADFLGDAGDDLAVSDATGAVRIYDADAPSSPVTADANGFAAAPGPLVGYDDDRDGEMDLLGAGEDGGVRGGLYYRNNGVGLVGVAETADWDVQLTVAGDFDGDGHGDAVVSSRFAGSSLMSILAAGSQSFPVSSTPAALAGGDFNGDRDDDVAMLAAAGDSTLLTLSPTATSPFPAIAGLVTAAAADVDEDGRADLVTAHSDNSVQVRRSSTDDYAGPALVGPPEFINNPAPAVGSAPVTPGADRRCRLNGGTWFPCAAGPHPLGPLADGTHTFEMQEKRAEVTFWSLPSSVTFTVDTVAPAVPQLTLAPAAMSNQARFEFTGEPGASSECQVDGGGWAPCASPLEPALADGEHTVEVRLRDAGDNVSDLTAHAFELDTTAPAAPTLLAGPPASGTARTARFTFTGEPGANYECALDRPFKPCTSPAVFTGLALAGHRFAVRQTDLAGNIGLARETRFTVTAPRQDDPVDPAPEPRPEQAALAAPKNSVVAGRTLTVGCRVDHGALKSCTVTAYVRSGGKLVRVGAGRSGADGVVRVKLTRKGRRFVNRLGGVAIRLRLRATAADGTVLTDSLRVRVLPQRALVIPSDGLFASGSATPLPHGRRYVRRIAHQLAGAKRVSCLGHTDSIGTEARNRRLGLARAKAVCRLLRTAGVKAKLRAASGGETQPRASNLTARGRALNRRVELTVRY